MNGNLFRFSSFYVAIIFKRCPSLPAMLRLRVFLSFSSAILVQPSDCTDPVMTMRTILMAYTNANKVSLVVCKALIDKV